MPNAHFWLNFLLDLVLTLLIYSGPILVYRIKNQEPISIESARKICLLYGIFSFALMSCIIHAINGEGAATATILVYYWLNKWILTRKKKEVILPSSKESPGKWYTCDKCGRRVAWGQKCDCSSEQTVIAPPPLTPENDVSPANIEESFVPSVPAESPGEKPKVYDPLAAPEKKPGMFSRVVAIVSTALCIVFIVISFYFGVSYVNALGEISEYKDRTAKYESQIDALKEQRADYIYQIQELEEFNHYSFSIGFMVSDDDYMYYHRYNCEVVKNAESYQCHNNEFCKFLGAEPCPECHNRSFSDLAESMVPPGQ